MSPPSIVPIALTLDDRTGYTLWAPPWEEDGEEWQAFLGSTVDLPADINDDDPEAPGPTAVVHLFPSPAALAAFCRGHTDHDLADHPVWPVVAGLGPPTSPRTRTTASTSTASTTWSRRTPTGGPSTSWPPRRHRRPAGRVLRHPGRARRDDDEDDTAFESVAELVSRPEVAALGLGIDAFLGRDGEGAWARLGTAIDELWEDVLEELDDHLDWTGAGTVSTEDYPSAAEEAEARAAEPEDDEDDETWTTDPGRRAAGATAAARPRRRPPASAPSAAAATLAVTPAAVAAAQEFWEAVGILPVEVVVPEGAGLTLRCYVEDRARFLGRDGQVFVFPTPVELARFCAGDEAHDLTEIASWPEVADTDTLPLPADQDRYDLVEISEVLAEVAAGAGGLVEHRALLQPVEGVLDLAEYADLPRVPQQLAPDAPLGRALARATATRAPRWPRRRPPALVTAWASVVEDIGDGPGLPQRRRALSEDPTALIMGVLPPDTPSTACRPAATPMIDERARDTATAGPRSAGTGRCRAGLPLSQRRASAAGREGRPPERCPSPDPRYPPGRRPSPPGIPVAVGALARGRSPYERRGRHRERSPVAGHRLRSRSP